MTGTPWRDGLPRPGKDAQCEDCGLVYELDEKGRPKTYYPFTCDDCSGAVEPVRE